MIKSAGVCPHYPCSMYRPLVHGPDPENLVIGTIRGDNFYHIFWKAGILGSLKIRVGRVKAVA